MGSFLRNGSNFSTSRKGGTSERYSSLATPNKLRFKCLISANHWNSNGTQSDFDDHAEVFGGQY